MVQIEMEKCILHHVKLLNICNEVAETFNGVYLAQCCVTSIILCITAITLSSVRSPSFIMIERNGFLIISFFADNDIDRNSHAVQFHVVRNF